MNVIFLLILVSMALAAGFLVAFIWAVRAGQYDDTCTPSMRMLLEESEQAAPRPPKESNQVESKHEAGNV